MTSEIDTQSLVQVLQMSQNKREKMNLKRMIRKQKLNYPNHQCQKHKPILKTTKQQKLRHQKEKNRQAAQKSRDLHRQYVNKLQKEIQQLNQKLTHSNSLCHRCQRYLSLNEEPIFQDIQYQNQHPIELFKPLEDSDIEIHIGDMEYHSNESDSFMRIYDSEESNNFIKMVLFVVVICVGVVVMNSSDTNFNSGGRKLFEIYQPIHEEQHQINAQQSQHFIEKDSVHGNGLVQLQKNIDNSVCMDSLMNMQNIKLKKSLRTLHHQDFQPEEGIFICTFQSPRYYDMKPQITQVPLVKLFVLGSQIKDMLNTSSNYSNFIDKNIQLNGIYRINAQLKSVDLVTHHNCLL